jgi:hypothetical protein
MFIWFITLAVAGVFTVFRDPRIDYRAVAVGALFPDVVDGVARRGVGPLHSVVTAVGLLGVVMVATIGRRPSRRKLLAFVVGVFAHLVLDGAWTSTRVFWWPLLGSLPKANLPSLDRSVGLLIMQEAAGLAVGIWLYRKFSMSKRTNRNHLVRTGGLGA